jgi:probable HAF family extracellular repeat protein
MVRKYCVLILATLIISVTGFIISNSAIAQEYLITDLGTLGEGWSRAFGINDLGRVVGESNSLSGPYPGQPHAFLWRAKTGMQDLGTLGIWSWAYDVNNKLEIVGRTSTTYYEDHAFFWNKKIGMIDIGVLNGGDDVWALGINDLSEVVGESNVSSGVYHAFMWTQDNGMTDLHTLGNLGGDWSGARDINHKGQIVGWSETASGDFHAVIWSRDGEIRDLGTFEGFDAFGWGTNDPGVVVGYMAGQTGGPSEGSVLAFRWTEQGGMIDLGSLGGNVSYAWEVNSRGQVVGSSQVASGMFHPFIWDETHGMRDLNNLIAPDSRWLLETNFYQDLDINESGQIVGCGLVDLDGDGIFDAVHAFLLTPRLQKNEVRSIKLRM